MSADGTAQCPSSPWTDGALWHPPRYEEVPEMGEGDIHAIFYESQPWEGRPTRVFPRERDRGGGVRWARMRRAVTGVQPQVGN